MGLSELAVVFICLAVVFVEAQTANPQNPVTDAYIPHASYPFSDMFGTGPISAYRENPLDSYDDPPSTSLVSTN